MAEHNNNKFDFEKRIWDAACILRGNMDAGEYKYIILGLIFLKYISDSFESKHAELLAEGEGFEDDRDEYISENIFYVPQSARWSAISSAAHTPEIGSVIDAAMRDIEADNPKQLKGILPKNFARQELDKRKLGEIVDLFTNITMFDHEDERDLLGRTYEYCLAQFAAQEGKNAGEFYTPSCVVRTIVEVLQPYNGVVYDPCCGSGGMFVQSYDFIKEHRGNLQQVSIYGQDSNPTTRKLAKMNLAIRGIEANIGEYNADTFQSDLHPKLRADYIMANPPFNLDNWGANSLQDDVRWKYGVPPDSNANFAWIQHMLYHLNSKGKIGLVLANTALSIGSGSEYEIRRQIIEDDLVECVVSLPAQLFFSTKIKVSLWFLNKNKKNKGKILFIDARKLGKMKTRTLKEFTRSDISEISNTVMRFQDDDKYVDEIGFSYSASIEEVRKKSYNISPSKYLTGSLDAIDIADWTEVCEQEMNEMKEQIEDAKQIRMKIEDLLPDKNDLRSSESFLSTLGVLNLLAANSQNLDELLKNVRVYENIKQQIQKTAERVSNELFKYWFIDFNFPDSDCNPYRDIGGDMKEAKVGLIPIEWDCKKMGDLLTIRKERVGDRCGIPEYSITNRGVFPRTEKFNKSLSQNSSKNKLIEYGDIVFGMSREIFNFGVMKETIGSVSPAYHVYSIDATTVNPEFLEILMRNCPDYFLSLIKPGAREGQVLDKDELCEKLIVVPPIVLQNKFMFFKKMLPDVIEGKL